MVTKGVVFRGLMDEVQRSFVIQLMEKYGLAVPIHDDDPLHVAVSNNMPPCALKSSAFPVVGKYVFPALLRYLAHLCLCALICRSSTVLFLSSRFGSSDFFRMGFSNACLERS